MLHCSNSGRHPERRAIGTSLAVLHFATSHRLASAALVAADEATRQAQVAALDQMAVFEALYWGGMYTIGLVALYLVPAALIARALERVGQETPRAALDPASLQSWREVLRPALGALALFAPLATGALSTVMAQILGG